MATPENPGNCLAAGCDCPRYQLNYTKSPTGEPLLIKYVYCESHAKRILVGKPLELTPMERIIADIGDLERAWRRMKQIRGAETPSNTGAILARHNAAVELHQILMRYR
jgi:hypothetical protein